MARKKDKKVILEQQVVEASFDAMLEDMVPVAADDIIIGDATELEVQEAVQPAPVEGMSHSSNADAPGEATAASLYQMEFENNSLEDPELTVSAFDRGGRSGRGRTYDPRLKPQGMPRHKEKRWRDLPLAGKAYEIVYYLCLVVFCISIGVLGARGYVYMTHKQQVDSIKDLYVRDPIITSTPGPIYTDVPTLAPSNTPPAGDYPMDNTQDVTQDVTQDITGDGTTNVTEDITQPQGPFIPTPPPVSTPVPQVRPSFSSLLSINRDVVGWIQLTGTVINYPVLQSHDDNNKSFYIDHDIFGKGTYYGSIFMDYFCSSDNLGRNTIISGHHMQDGEMFRQIANYTSTYMWKQNPIIYFDTLYESYEWEVFASFLVDADSEKIPVTFSSDNEFIDYCNSCLKRSTVKLAQNVQFGPNDKILTLVTCSYNGKYADERTFTIFRLVERSGELDTDGTWKPTTPRLSGSWK